MNKKAAFVLLATFFFSRFFFINSQDVFFDSGEYLNAFSNPNFTNALISVHFPMHQGYTLLFWPIFNIAKLFYIDGGYTVVLGQISLATITIYCFYKFLVFISDKKTALFGSIIASLTPLFWITNVTIMMENAYTTYFFLSLYWLVQYLSNTNKSLNAHLSSLFFSFTVITQPIIILWLPFLLIIIFIKNKKSLKKYITYVLSYLIGIIILNLLFISVSMNMSMTQAFHEMYLAKKNEFPFLYWDIRSMLIILRNLFIPLASNNTNLIVILAFISIITIYLKNKKLFLISLFWILPALYVNQWWDSLLTGRHALITGFGLAFLTGYLTKKSFIYFGVIIIYLLTVSLPTINLLKKDIPYIKLAEFTKTLPKNSLLVESHFSRPQVEKRYQGKLVAVNGFGSSVIMENINIYLKKKRPVFISSHALSDPYGLYSGPYLHSLSFSYRKPPELDSYLNNYTLTEYKTIDKNDNLIIYKIESNKNGSYPKIKLLNNSYRQLGYFDPLFLLTQWTNSSIHSFYMP